MNPKGSNFYSDPLGRWASWRALSDRIVNSKFYQYGIGHQTCHGLIFRLERFASEMMGVHNNQRWSSKRLGGYSNWNYLP